MEVRVLFAAPSFFFIFKYLDRRILAASWPPGGFGIPDRHPAVTERAAALRHATAVSEQEVASKINAPIHQEHGLSRWDRATLEL